MIQTSIHHSIFHNTKQICPGTLLHMENPQFLNVTTVAACPCKPPLNSLSGFPMTRPRHLHIRVSFKASRVFSLVIGPIGNQGTNVPSPNGWGCNSDAVCMGFPNWEFGFMLTKLSVWILPLVLVCDHCGSWSTALVEHVCWMIPIHFLEKRGRSHCHTNKEEHRQGLPSQFVSQFDVFHPKVWVSRCGHGSCDMLWHGRWSCHQLLPGNNSGAKYGHSCGFSGRVALKGFSFQKIDS